MMKPVPTNHDTYRRYEMVAGRDPFWKVWGYRLNMVMVDVFSVSGVFCTIMTIILYKFFKVFLLAADKGLQTGTLVAFCGMGTAIFAVFTMAWVYFAMRKYSPPIVEAVAMRLSGCKGDIEVPTENGNGGSKPASGSGAPTEAFHS